MTPTSTAQYVRFDQPNVEFGFGAEEDRTINEIAALINESQRRVLDAHHHAFSGTHVKTHGILKGTLRVLPDLPVHLAQSMFANANSVHPVAVRFSSEPTDLVGDTVPQPRGVGMKIFNVDGKKLRQDGKDPRTQDIEFNSSPVLELGNATVCRDIITLRLAHADPNDLTAELKKRDDFHVQDARNHGANQHVFCQRQYSQSAFRYGDYVAKFALVPVGEAQLAMGDRMLNEKDDDKIALRNGLQQFVKANDLLYDLQVQLLQNLDEQPTEDSRVEWDQDKYPFHTVARITIPAGQDAYLPARVNFWRDQIRVDPWHGREDLKPLGSINRVRKTVYKSSAAFRRRANGHVKEVTVDSVDQIPDN